MRPATRAATAPIRSSTSASTSARFSPRSSAERSGEEVGWHYGFTAAGVGMTLGLVIYLFAIPHLPPDELQKAVADGVHKKPLDRNEWRSILALVALFVPTTLFWAAYEQSGNTIALWADDYTDRSINLILWRGEIPTTWFQAFNPFMIFAFTPFIIALWGWQAKRGREPSTVTKMSLGCFALALANLIMVSAAWRAAGARSKLGCGCSAISPSSPSASFISPRSGCRWCPRSRRRAWSRC